MKEKIKNYLTNELLKANEDLEKICNVDFEQKRFKEIVFLFDLGFSEELIEKLLKKIDLKDEQIAELIYTIEEYNLMAIVVLKFLILKLNLQFNQLEKFSNNKPRFDNQIMERKQIFDISQRYKNDEQLFFPLPKRDLDLFFGFREFITRYKFCTDEVVRILLSLIGMKKLPPMPTDWKESNKKWRENIINDLTKFQDEYGDEFTPLYLNEEERLEYLIKQRQTIKRANQYKPKKL